MNTLSQYDTIQYERGTDQEKKDYITDFVLNNLEDLQTISKAIGAAKNEIEDKTKTTTGAELVAYQERANIETIRKNIPYVAAGSLLIFLALRMAKL